MLRRLSNIHCQNVFLVNGGKNTGKNRGGQRHKSSLIEMITSHCTISAAVKCECAFYVPLLPLVPREGDMM
jgi:hypothetical protein